MVAILRPEFMENAVKFPTNEEKQEAQRWVQEHSCRSWKGGWCFVDGFLIPLATHPEWFGESYWDHKDRYSLNVQISTYFSFFQHLRLGSHNILSHFQICVSLTSAMGILEALMIQELGRLLVLWKNMMFFSVFQSGCGRTQHIQ
jgi:hypothetical protein